LTYSASPTQGTHFPSAFCESDSGSIDMSLPQWALVLSTYAARAEVPSCLTAAPPQTRPQPKITHSPTAIPRVLRENKAKIVPPTRSQPLRTRHPLGNTIQANAQKASPTAQPGHRSSPPRRILSNRIDDDSLILSRLRAHLSPTSTPRDTRSSTRRPLAQPKSRAAPRDRNAHPPKKPLQRQSLRACS